MHGKRSVAPLRQAQPTDGERSPKSPSQRLAWLRALQADSRLERGATIGVPGLKARCAPSAVVAVASALVTAAVDGSGRVWCGLAMLAERSHHSRSTVQAALAWLAWAGWIETTQRKQGHRNEANIHHLNWPDGIPLTGTPLPESGIGVYRTETQPIPATGPKRINEREIESARAKTWIAGQSAHDWVRLKTAHGGDADWKLRAWIAAGRP